jgi:hypothetical protein
MEYIKSIDLNTIQDIFGKESDFKSEKDLTEYIDSVINDISLILTGNKCLHYKKNYGFQLLISNKPLMADYLIETTANENIIIECKNPSQNVRESIAGISQLMGYFLAAKMAGIEVKKFCLLTTKFNELIIAIVNEFNLPFSIVFIKKGELYLFDKSSIKNV